METKLRFGILCNSMVIEKWQERAILRLLEIENVELSLVIINSQGKESGISTENYKSLFPSHLLFYAYQRLIQNRFKSKVKVDMSSALSKTPQITCTPIYKEEKTTYFSNDDADAICGYALDFILCFVDYNLRGKILNTTRYGVWSFHHDDEQKYRGKLPCFWEIYRDDKITGAVLMRLTDELYGGIVLNKGYFPTSNHSYVENVDKILFASAEWPAKVCRGIINGNDKVAKNLSYKTNAPIYEIPDNTQMTEFLLRIAYNCFKYVYNYLFRNDEWNIGIIDKPIHSILSGNIEPKWLPRPDKGTFIADPFGKSVGGKSIVMVEDLDYHVGRANIAVMEIDDADIKTYTKKSAIQFPCHMSYPYLIDYENEIYLIPETYESRRVVLLKAKDFPNEWEQVSILVSNFAAVDPTVFYYNDYWWLMCTNRDTDSNSDLYIWYAKDLFGPWEPHTANPVKTDIKSSRPGGTPFVYNGELYRPAQNSIHTYGGSLVINKVTKLTTDEFEEEEVLEVKPDENSIYNKGIHTVATMGDKTVVDGKRFVFIPDLLIERCLRIVRKVRVPQLIPRFKQ